MSDVGDLAYSDLVLRLDGSVIKLLMTEAERERVPVLGAVSY